MAALAVLAVLAQLTLPLLHQVLASAHAGAAVTSHGVGIEPAAASDATPVECTLCDALAQGRRPFGTPCAALDAASPDEPAATRACFDPGAPRSAEHQVHAARAPPVRSVSA